MESKNRQPLSYIQWRSANNIELQNNAFELYRKYLFQWHNENKEDSKIFVDGLKNLYVAIIQGLENDFTDFESKNFLDKLDYWDAWDVSVALPYFSQKLKEIYLSVSHIRKDVSFQNFKNYLKGSKSILQSELRKRVLEEFTDYELSLHSSNNSLSSSNELNVYVEELFDTSEYSEKDRIESPSTIDLISEKVMGFVAPWNMGFYKFYKQSSDSEVFEFDSNTFVKANSTSDNSLDLNLVEDLKISQYKGYTLLPRVSNTEQESFTGYEWGINQKKDGDLTDSFSEDEFRYQYRSSAIEKWDENNSLSSHGVYYYGEDIYGGCYEVLKPFEESIWSRSNQKGIIRWTMTDFSGFKYGRDAVDAIYQKWNFIGSPLSGDYAQGVNEEILNLWVIEDILIFESEFSYIFEKIEYSSSGEMVPKIDRLIYLEKNANKLASIPPRIHRDALFIPVCQQSGESLEFAFWKLHSNAFDFRRVSLEHEIAVGSNLTLDSISFTWYDDFEGIIDAILINSETQEFCIYSIPFYLTSGSSISFGEYKMSCSDDRAIVSLSAFPVSLSAEIDSLFATSDENYIEVSWDVSSDTSYDGIQIQKQINSSGFKTVAVVPQEVDSWKDVKTAFDVEYQYRARTLNYFGEGSWEMSSTISLKFKLPSPSNFSVKSLGDGLVNIYWENPQQLLDTVDIQYFLSGDGWEDYEVGLSANDFPILSASFPTDGPYFFRMKGYSTSISYNESDWTHIVGPILF